ncbi:hypothetical protein [uncultured Sutterella sp.]|uniref:hypothetical protein n=1 Tax=uncultured Sutterella sp. TaxID=286133 RepID=UPI0026077FBF|nr:hypothetical protein [uncultured Sutterella sp.]
MTVFPPGGPEEKRCYRVRGPYLLEGEALPPDGLELIAESDFCIDVHAGHLGKEEWTRRLEMALDAQGANALTDCTSPKKNWFRGRPALVVRVNRFGEESTAALRTSFRPLKDSIDLTNVVLPKEPIDRGRILRVVFLSLVAFLGILFLFLLSGVLLTLLFAS